MKKLLFLFLVITANTIFAQDEVLLRLNYENNATYSTKTIVSQEMGAMMSMEMTMDMEMEVTAVENENYDTKTKFTNMSMEMLQGGNLMTFDSSKSDDELDAAGKMMKSQMGPMLEAVIYSKVTTLGEASVVSIEPMIPGVEDIASQSSAVVYPKEAVKLGSTWTMSKEEKGMKMDFLYTVQSISKENVLVDVSGEVSGMGSGKISGNVTIDRVSGIPMKSLVEMNLSVAEQKFKMKATTETAKK
jgi:hypothetical protein